MVLLDEALGRLELLREDVGMLWSTVTKVQSAGAPGRRRPAAPRPGGATVHEVAVDVEEARAGGNVGGGALDEVVVPDLCKGKVRGEEE